MLERYGIVLLSPDEKKHLLEECNFYKAVYEHNKEVLEFRARKIFESQLSILIYENLYYRHTAIDIFNLVRMACEKSIPHLKVMLRGISFIRNYLTSEFIKEGENKELILEEIGKYVLED